MHQLKRARLLITVMPEKEVCCRFFVLFFSSLEIVIVRHPVSVCVPVNHKVTLSVRAQGTGILNYQWFTDGAKNEVPNGTLADLTIRAQQTQLYVCRVNDQYYKCVFSNWVKVKVLDIDKSGKSSYWQGEPHIATNPKPQKIQPGTKLVLQCAAFGVPAPSYQWYRNGQPLHEQCDLLYLQIERATAEHSGTYLCSLSNTLGERWTEPVDVDIGKLKVKPKTKISTTLNFLAATDKVALLIGNLNYSNHPALMAPVMDVHELGNLLRQLGFRVVSLLDLTREEMLTAIEKFIHLLDKGVYGLFYYAGHGYEHAGRNYLVSVDAPQPYGTENCVCVQRIMLSMQERQTALSVILLDTCRKW
uniref:MALT paracaspase 3 n=1 Tax=Astatotilapia calliptera TaxID=8154 RepID=A0A3P8QK37_ASTCA